MSPRPEPAWWAEARAWRARGYSSKETARIMGRSVRAVARAVSGKQRDLADERLRRQRERKGRPQHRPGASLSLLDAGMVIHRTPRPIRPVINRQALRAILDNREGSIPTAELMARITSGAQP